MLIGIDASRAVTGRRTGTEAYAYFLLQALVPLTAESGHHLRLYFNQSPPANLSPDFAHVEPCIIPMARLWSQVRLARELAQRPPDVFFTPAHVIPFAYRGRSVATIHDLGFHHFPEAHTRSQLAYLKFSTRLNGRAAARIIADSQATKADLLRFYGLPEEKIDVIYPGIDSALTKVTDPERLGAVQRKYGIDMPYLLYIGTIQPRKNLARLVQSFLACDLPHQLVLAGKVGWNSRPIIAEIESLELWQRERLLLPGFIAEEDKAALISGAQALLFPSLYEGFGFPVLESQACGTPVLASNTSSLPEIAGEGALLVDPLSSCDLTLAMRRIIDDSELRRELVIKGLQNVQRFSWRKTAAAVLQTLESAV
jgi:glycosyltransferase involved in cell wall biosynthesis